MITNIFLGLILGVVITSFIILNIKINRTEFNTKFIIDALKRIDKFIEANNIVINNVRDRLSIKELKDNEHWVTNEEYYNNIIILLKSRFKDLDNTTDSIYDRFNTIHADIEKYIAAEHIITRRQIEKQAKISSKINSKRKQSNNTQK